MECSCRCSRAAARGAAALVTLVGLAGTRAGAQAPKPCTLICAPTIAFNFTGNKSHIFGSPSVRNDTTGAVTKLPSTTNVELQVFASAKTQWNRLLVFANTSWLPNAKTSANPFTQYTASDVGESHVRANHLSLTLGFLGDVVPAKQAKGFFELQAYAGDLISPAARPDDESAYTNKLDVGGVGLVYPFAGMDTTSAAHRTGLYVFGNLDYVATGLPKAGDDVPKGVRTFVTSAKPALLIFGIGMPIAPLLQAK